MKYKVVEIFDSIDGEGIRTGQLVSFIRLAGCNLRCSYCDTLYALFGEDEPCSYKELTLEEIEERVNSSFRRITLTGGEPLITPGAPELIRYFTEKGYEVNIETNGAAPIQPVLDAVDSKGMFFTIDYKLPSSGMEEKMLWENFLRLRPRDVVKFVAGSCADLEAMLRVAEKLNAYYKTPPKMYIGTVYKALENKDVIGFMQRHEALKDAVFQLQIHKIIWDPDQKGV